MAETPELWEAARSLYASALPDFVGARNALASDLKKAGEAETARRVAIFKKPSVAADLVNRLVRNSAQLADEVIELGEKLRTAQVGADAATLRALDQERRGLLTRIVASARVEAARNDGVATDAVLHDVEQTFWAAIVDSRAAATVRAGVLVRPLSPSGFGEVDVTGASAIDVDLPAEPDRQVRRTPSKRPPSRSEPASAGPSAAEVRARQEAAEALEEAQATSRQAQQQLMRAVNQVEAADARRINLENERDRLRNELSQNDRSLADTRQELTRRRAALKLAETQKRSAAAEVEKLLRRLT